MDRLAHKCLSLQFLLEFNEKVVQPYRPTMTVKEVVEDILIPATKEKQCSFIDQLRPNIYVWPHVFISHAFGNRFAIIIASLKSYFKDAVFTEVYVWIDIFIINQHLPGDDLHDGLTLRATIEACGSVLVCLDKNTLPLFRLWCLYEIGSTPIEKLVLLTHGFDPSELGQAYAKIDATTADCWAQSDKDMIREHIRTMMIEQKIVDSSATVTEALTAFTRVLKLLLLLKPTSYSVDMAALLSRATGYESYPLKHTVGQASDIRRQDRGLVIRSLSYQLASRHEDFAQTILDLTPSEVESLSDEATAWKLLLETPLKAARGNQFTTLKCPVIPLRSHWKGERYKEFSPSELRGEGKTVSPLLRTLTGIIQRTSSDPNTVVFETISNAYDTIFGHGTIGQHREVLEVVLASYQPQSLSDLKAMGLLESARRLPGYGELFMERENKLHLLHRSIAEWLKEPGHGAVNVKSGHERLAEHIWETALQPWLLLPADSSYTLWEPLPGSYSLKYALDHLREAGRFQDIEAILFRLPWLQAMLREKGLGALIKDILSLTMDHSILGTAAKNLVAVLRLSSSALLGIDSWKYLPAQLLGRLRETEEDALLHSLREESNSLTTGR
eukprot:gene31418-biopygen25115